MSIRSCFLSKQHNHQQGVDWPRSVAQRTQQNWDKYRDMIYYGHSMGRVANTMDSSGAEFTWWSGHGHVALAATRLFSRWTVFIWIKNRFEIQFVHTLNYSYHMRKMVTPTNTRNNDPIAIMATIQMLNSSSSKFYKNVFSSSILES